MRFADGLRTLATLRPDVCVEVGPNPALLAFASSTLGDDIPALVPTLRKGRNDIEQALDGLATAYLAGADVTWRGVYAGESRRITDLPSYPFERERWWFEARAGGRTPTKITARERVGGHPLLGHRVRSPLEDVAQFEVTLHTDTLPFLDDHRVHGRAILPATGYVEMALAAANALFGDGRAIEDLIIAEPLVVTDDAPRRVQFIARLNDDGGASFEIHSTADGDSNDPWIRHAEGRLGVAPSAPVSSETIDAISARCGDAITADAHYAALARRGLAFGPSLRGVVGIHRRDGEAIGEITSIHSLDGEATPYHLHPAFLDACLQVISAALPAARGDKRAYLPLAVEQITRHRPPNGRTWSRAVVHSRDGDTLRADVRVLDAHGVVAELRGLSLRAARDTAAEGTHSDLLYEMAWLPAPDESAAFLPTPPQLAERLSPLFPKLAETHGLIAYHAAFIELESLAAAYVVRALRILGWTFETGECVTGDELARALGVVPRYRRLLARLLDILAEDGMLRKEGGAYEVVAVRPESDVFAQSEALLARHPSSHARLTLAAKCGEELASVLRGTVDPLQLLFPGGSPELAESLYQHAPESQVFNQLVREAVRAAVESLPAGRRLRVLEVGGGTGGTTSWVAPMLPTDRVEYLFTDVSPLLVQRARERFADFPFMQFQVLDLEKDLASQGVDGQFDLVIAINVIHATEDLSATLRRVHRALVPGGTLLMLEVAGLERWIDITFGLTEGWWRFTDTALRRDYPLLPRKQWQPLLAALGFDAAVLTDETPLSREALIAARKSHNEPVVRDAGTWLLFADAGGVGNGLAARLRADGQRVVLVHPGPAFSIAGDAAHLDPTKPANYRDLFAADLGTLRGVVHLWSLDVDTPPDRHGRPADDAQASASLDAGQRHALGSLLAIVQALGARSFLAGAAPGLWITTRGAQ
ncbi:MAG TPA: polyketide synthase dehydratase domain-containing protein, partial [Gemmatimonadaceae bacterium]